jgi:hypothetical protein
MAERGDEGKREEDFPIYKSCDLRVQSSIRLR